MRDREFHDAIVFGIFYFFPVVGMIALAVWIVVMLMEWIL